MSTDHPHRRRLARRPARRWLAPLLATLTLGACAPGHAFCPKNGFVCFITSKSAGSLTHQDLTQRGIEELD